MNALLINNYFFKTKYGRNGWVRKAGKLCFGCGATGDVIDLFVEALQNITHVEYLPDILLSGETGEKEQLLREHGKEVLYGIRKHFDCNSEVSFEECAFYIKGSSLWSKVVFVVICTGGKSLFDFCKSSSTTVEGSNFYVKESMVYVCVVNCFYGR